MRSCDKSLADDIVELQEAFMLRECEQFTKFTLYLEEVKSKGLLKPEAYGIPMLGTQTLEDAIKIAAFTY